jgi:hypothetical protein
VVRSHERDQREEREHGGHGERFAQADVKRS